MNEYKELLIQTNRQFLSIHPSVTDDPYILNQFIQASNESLPIIHIGFVDTFVQFLLKEDQLQEHAQLILTITNSLVQSIFFILNNEPITDESLRIYIWAIAIIVKTIPEASDLILAHDIMTAFNKILYSPLKLSKYHMFICILNMINDYNMLNTLLEDYGLGDFVQESISLEISNTDLNLPIQLVSLMAEHYTESSFLEYAIDYLLFCYENGNPINQQKALIGVSNVLEKDSSFVEKCLNYVDSLIESIGGTNRETVSASLNIIGSIVDSDFYDIIDNNKLAARLLCLLKHQLPRTTPKVLRLIYRCGLKVDIIRPDIAEMIYKILLNSGFDSKLMAARIVSRLFSSEHDAIELFSSPDIISALLNVLETVSDEEISQEIVTGIAAAVTQNEELLETEGLEDALNAVIGVNDDIEVIAVSIINKIDALCL